jgi:peptidoglycan DL-endopeptidase CwlO
MNRARTSIRTLLAGILLAVAIAAPASADAIADKKAEAARVAKRIEDLHAEAERLTEQYNKAVYELKAVSSELANTESQVVAKDQESASLANRATQVAVRAYMYGGASDGPTRLIDDLSGNESAPREAYLSTLLGDLNDVSDQVRAVRQDAATHQRLLDAQQARKTALIAATEAKRKGAEKAIGTSQALLKTVKGDLVDLVRQEQERRAREAEAAAKKAAEERIAKERAAAAAAAQAASDAALAARRTAAGVRVPAARKQPAANGPSYNFPAPSAAAARVVAAAKSQLGVPYVWATANPGVSFDCSGLTQWAWAQAGVSMDHYTVSQYNQFPKIPYEAMQPGDLVFFGSDLHHMGLYIGGGMMIEAPYTGSWVRYSSILSPEFAGAVRPG